MYQFIHIETYARKPSKVGKKSNWTARDIADEADRKPEACKHVENPKAPAILFGVSPSAAVDFAETEVAKEAVSGKTKDGKAFSKAVRADMPILLAGVASYPKDGEHYEEWRALTLDWLKSKYGAGLRSVVEHTDEEHPHLHFYVVADKPSKTRALYHDGFREGQETARFDKATAGKAYREGMKDLQDAFWRSVASRVGMARTGPKRARLSRPEWEEEKRKNMMVAEALNRANIKEAEADEILATAIVEAEAKSKEATDILRKASDTVRQAVRDKLGALVNEEVRLTKWGAFLSKIDERLKPQIEAAQKSYQPDGPLAARVAPKVGQSGGTTGRFPTSKTSLKP